MNNIISTNNMDKRTLSQLSKAELIQMLLKQKIDQKSNKELIQSLLKKNIEMTKLIQKKKPAPRKSVKQMVQDYEDNIILPPPEIRDNYKPIPKPRTKKPVPLPRTKIEQVAKAMKGYTKSLKLA